MIKINDLCKNYEISKNSLPILNHIDLQINEGEFIGIVGNSGSGKSTLINIIAGLDKPSSGDVIVDDLYISKLNDKEISKYRNKTIGFVFQAFNLLPSLTALENVMLPLKYSNISLKKRVEMAEKSLEMVGLSDRLNHKPGQLSGGQKQRVSVARAIINSPKILIADEPTGNLDTKSGELVLNLLSNLNKQGYTILMVTHNKNHTDLFNKVVTIKDGQILRNI